MSEPVVGPKGRCTEVRMVRGAVKPGDTLHHFLVELDVGMGLLQCYLYVLQWAPAGHFKATLVALKPSVKWAPRAVEHLPSLMAGVILPPTVTVNWANMDPGQAIRLSGRLVGGLLTGVLTPDPAKTIGGAGTWDRLIREWSAAIVAEGSGGENAGSGGLVLL